MHLWFISFVQWKTFKYMYVYSKLFVPKKYVKISKLGRHMFNVLSCFNFCVLSHTIVEQNEYSITKCGFSMDPNHEKICYAKCEQQRCRSACVSTVWSAPLLLNAKVCKSYWRITRPSLFREISEHLYHTGWNFTRLSQTVLLVSERLMSERLHRIIPTVKSLMVCVTEVPRLLIASVCFCSWADCFVSNLVANLQRQVLMLCGSYLCDLQITVNNTCMTVCTVSYIMLLSTGCWCSNRDHCLCQGYEYFPDTESLSSI